MDEIRRSFARAGLYRSRDDRVLGGVCTGLGRRVGIDPWPARILMLVLMIVVPGSREKDRAGDIPIGSGSGKTEPSYPPTPPRRRPLTGPSALACSSCLRFNFGSKLRR